MPRGRPKTPPQIRFREEIDIWLAAENRITSGQGALVIRCVTDGHAIAQCHKLNACRAALREETANYYHIWDEYAVNRKDSRVIIGLKQSVFDRVTFETQDGQTIPKDELQQTAWKQQKNNEEMTSRTTNKQYIPLAPNQPKLDGQGRPIRGNEDVPDPNKSLIDC